MKKGVIFSIDAALALIIVMMLAGWLAVQASTTDENAGSFQRMQENALDRATIKYYSGFDATQSETVTGIAATGKCVMLYEINPNNDLGVMAPLEKMQVCAEK